MVPPSGLSWSFPIRSDAAVSRDQYQGFRKLAHARAAPGRGEVVGWLPFLETSAQAQPQRVMWAPQEMGKFHSRDDVVPVCYAPTTPPPGQQPALSRGAREQKGGHLEEAVQSDSRADGWNSHAPYWSSELISLFHHPWGGAGNNGPHLLGPTGGLHEFLCRCTWSRVCPPGGVSCCCYSHSDGTHVFREGSPGFSQQAQVSFLWPFCLGHDPRLLHG